VEGRPLSVDPEFLAQVPIFGGLPQEVLAEMIEVASLRRFEAGVELIAEGDLAKTVFVVCQGELEIRKRGKAGSEFRLAVLKRGDCVGEMSLIDIQPRSASVWTLGPAMLLSLDHAYSAGLYRTHPEAYTLLVMNIAREISRRLRHADEILADMGQTAEETWRRLHTTTPG
jgi:CRP/FNR family transcriptional regulator, cyclic AMP receptor protein